MDRRPAYDPYRCGQTALNTKALNFLLEQYQAASEGALKFDKKVMDNIRLLAMGNIVTARRRMISNKSMQYILYASHGNRVRIFLTKEQIDALKRGEEVDFGGKFLSAVAIKSARLYSKFVANPDSDSGAVGIMTVGDESNFVFDKNQKTVKVAEQYLSYIDDNPWIECTIDGYANDYNWDNTPHDTISNDTDMINAQRAFTRPKAFYIDSDGTLRIMYNACYPNVFEGLRPEDVIDMFQFGSTGWSGRINTLWDIFEYSLFATYKKIYSRFDTTVTHMSYRKNMRHFPYCEYFKSKKQKKYDSSGGRKTNCSIRRWCMPHPIEPNGNYFNPEDNIGEVAKRVQDPHKSYYRIYLNNPRQPKYCLYLYVCTPGIGVSRIKFAKIDKA